MNGVMALLLAALSDRVICGLVADVLKQLRPLASESSTSVDDAVLEALIQALETREKGA